jgi:hypothetical protein
MGDQEPLINKITSFFTGKYMHCEIVFGRQGGQNLACGVWQNEHVFLRHKTFGKECWVWKSIKLSPDAINRMMRFCKRQATERKPFNKSGLYRCTTIFPRATDGTAWFCSELCMAALQEAGLFHNQAPGSITPSNLYSLLDSIDSYTNGSPLLDSRIQTHQLRFLTKKLRPMTIT